MHLRIYNVKTDSRNSGVNSISHLYSAENAEIKIKNSNMKYSNDLIHNWKEGYSEY